MQLTARRLIRRWLCGLPGGLLCRLNGWLRRRCSRRWRICQWRRNLLSNNNNNTVAIAIAITILLATTDVRIIAGRRRRCYLSQPWQHGWTGGGSIHRIVKRLLRLFIAWTGTATVHGIIIIVEVREGRVACNFGSWWVSTECG